MRAKPASNRRPWLRGFATFGCLGLAALVAPSASVAQTFPGKPIRMIIPNPPGGNSDLLGRSISTFLQERLGQPVVPDNRVGAGGIIAAQAAAEAPPDGHTLLMGNIGPNAINQSLYRKLPYDATKSFTPITLVMKVSNVLVVHPGVKANSVPDVIALAKARPGTLSYGSSGQGQSPHLAGEMFASLANVSMLHVPYRGAAPSVVALLGGEIDMIFENITNALPHIKAGKLRALAVTSGQRAGALPDIPTISEAGLPGYEVTSWFGVFGPAGMPAPVVDVLNREIRRWIDLPETQTRIGALGGQLGGNTPAEFAAFVQAEIAKWKPIIERAGLRAD